MFIYKTKVKYVVCFVHYLHSNGFVNFIFALYLIRLMYIPIGDQKCRCVSITNIAYMLFSTHVLQRFLILIGNATTTLEASSTNPNFCASIQMLYFTDSPKEN